MKLNIIIQLIISCTCTCRCGPLSNLWCMRFEAKHRYFKQVAKVIGNFKNIAKTLAYRHQRRMCYILSQPHLVFQDRVEAGPCKY